MGFSLKRKITNDGFFLKTQSICSATSYHIVATKRSVFDKLETQLHLYPLFFEEMCSPSPGQFE